MTIYFHDNHDSINKRPSDLYLIMIITIESVVNLSKIVVNRMPKLYYISNQPVPIMKLLKLVHNLHQTMMQQYSSGSLNDNKLKIYN